MVEPCRTPAQADGPMSLEDFLALEAEEGWRQEIVEGWPARFPFPSLIEEDLRDWLREQLRPWEEAGRSRRVMTAPVLIVVVAPFGA